MLQLPHFDGELLRRLARKKVKTLLGAPPPLRTLSCVCLCFCSCLPRPQLPLVVSGLIAGAGPHLPGTRPCRESKRGAWAAPSRAACPGVPGGACRNLRLGLEVCRPRAGPRPMTGAGTQQQQPLPYTHTHTGTHTTPPPVPPPPACPAELQQLSAEERQALLVGCGLAAGEVEEVETMLSGGATCLGCLGLSLGCLGLRVRRVEMVADAWAAPAAAPPAPAAAAAAAALDGWPGAAPAPAAAQGCCPSPSSHLPRCSACSHAHALGVCAMCGGGGGGEGRLRQCATCCCQKEPRPPLQAARCLAGAWVVEACRCLLCVQSAYPHTNVRQRALRHKVPVRLPACPAACTWPHRALPCFACCACCGQVDDDVVLEGDVVTCRVQVGMRVVRVCVCVCVVRACVCVCVEEQRGVALGGGGGWRAQFIFCLDELRNNLFPSLNSSRRRPPPSCLLSCVC